MTRQEADRLKADLMLADHLGCPWAWSGLADTLDDLIDEAVAAHEACCAQLARIERLERDRA